MLSVGLQCMAAGYVAAFVRLPYCLGLEVQVFRLLWLMTVGPQAFSALSHGTWQTNLGRSFC